ncbi:unnamed protein product [Anisakis simplex]|uniref:Fucosyltransferase n=1 Tax=Anisakis simplex TaxID=6269 RepID=A0A0M3JEW5_ANISI|nr:unnamed protein product [Anisakis simplex]
MQQLIVPIVLKRSIAMTFIPHGSFIAVDDFESPKHLADYLKRLLANKDEYLKYFQWTKRYSKNFDDDYGCGLCRFIHQNANKHRVVSDISDWWFNGATCINDFASTFLKNSSTDISSTRPTSSYRSSDGQTQRSIRPQI